MIEGPRVALVAGQSGDLAGFRAGFTGAGAAASDAEVMVFLASDRGRAITGAAIPVYNKA